jgi:hypothetical protein
LRAIIPHVGDRIMGDPRAMMIDLQSMGGLDIKAASIAKANKNAPTAASVQEADPINPEPSSWYATVGHPFLFWLARARLRGPQAPPVGGGSACGNRFGGKWTLIALRGNTPTLGPHSRGVWSKLLTSSIGFSRPNSTASDTPIRPLVSFAMQTGFNEK